MAWVGVRVQATADAGSWGTVGRVQGMRDRAALSWASFRYRFGGAYIVLAPSWVGTVGARVALDVDADILRRPGAMARGALERVGRDRQVLTQVVAMRAAVLPMATLDAIGLARAQQDAALALQQINAEADVVTLPGGVPADSARGAMLLLGCLHHIAEAR